MEEFALIKSRVNLNRVNLGIALISDLKVYQGFENPCLYIIPALQRVSIALLVFSVNKDKVSLLKKYLP